MDYQVSFTISADTAEADADSHTLEIAPGIINLVYVKGRPGAAGLPRVRIFWGEKQLFPSSPDEWYHVDWTPIQFQDRVLIFDFPFELTVKAYNLDTENDHSVVVRVNIWPLELFGAAPALPAIVENPWPGL